MHKRGPGSREGGRNATEIRRAAIPATMPPNGSQQRREEPLVSSRLTRHQGPFAPELELMQQIVQYNVEINCGPCPKGYVSRIARQMQTAFPVTSCQTTTTGLAMRMISGYRFADGALKDFADMVGETLTKFGIAMTMGVVRMVTRQSSLPYGGHAAGAGLRRDRDGHRLEAGSRDSGVLLLQGIAVRPGTVGAPEGDEPDRTGRTLPSEVMSIIRLIRVCYSQTRIMFMLTVQQLNHNDIAIS